MIESVVAANYTDEMLKSFRKFKTLRDFLSEYMNCSTDINDIKYAMDNEYKDLIESWARDNGMEYSGMYAMLLACIGINPRYEIELDREYDRKPQKFFRGKLSPKWFKEVRFTGRVLVDEYILELDEWFKDYEVDDPTK